jgi:hypothetical protein
MVAELLKYEYDQGEDSGTQQWKLDSINQLLIGYIDQLADKIEIDWREYRH